MMEGMTFCYGELKLPTRLHIFFTRVGESRWKASKVHLLSEVFGVHVAVVQWTSAGPDPWNLSSSHAGADVFLQLFLFLAR